MHVLKPFALALFLIFPSVAVSACGSSMTCGPSSDPNEREHCVQQGGPAEAVGTAAAAGVAWGTVGCRQNGCNMPFECNHDTGFCERMRCSEGDPCPPSFECDVAAGRCE